jgi:hypothetical protein
MEPNNSKPFMQISTSTLGPTRDNQKEEQIDLLIKGEHDSNIS